VRAGTRIPIGAVDVRPEDVEAVAAVLASGHLRQGAVTAEFERAFAARAGARHAVAVSSGTAALHLAYLALFSPGDEVLVPAFTFVATASMLVAVGAVPVFADVEPGSFTLSVPDARSRITDRTRGIAGAHLFGAPCDVDGLLELASEHGLTVVWDAAQALGARYRGREVGAFPSAACYSFYPSKTITTGEGGMVLTDDDDLADRLRLARSHGAAAKYEHVSLGFNYRLTDVQAALGLAQLGRLDGYLERRRANALALTEGLLDVPGIVTPTVEEGTEHAFNVYSVLVEPERAGLDRDELARRLAAGGIETAVHYPRPLHRQPMFDRGRGPGDARAPLPVSEDLSARILALPVHPKLERRDVAVLARAVAAAVAG
jgi:perosamine synthetase